MGAESRPRTSAYALRFCARWRRLGRINDLHGLSVYERGGVGLCHGFVPAEPREDLCSQAVANAELDWAAHGLAGDDGDAVILPRFAHDGGHRQGQDVGVVFGDDGRVGIEARLKLCAGLGISISTRSVRTFGSIAQETRVTLPSTVLPFNSWSLTVARSPGLTCAANASGTLTLIVMMSDRATTKSGGLSAPG